MLDKVQKHNSFNTNIPSSESYKNYQIKCIKQSLMKQIIKIATMQRV
jgi:hypothetical protein